MSRVAYVSVEKWWSSCMSSAVKAGPRASSRHDGHGSLRLMSSRPAGYCEARRFFCGMAALLGEECLMTSGQMHSTPSRVQLEHVGCVSSHYLLAQRPRQISRIVAVWAYSALTLLCLRLHSMHPFRDLVCGFLVDML